MGLWKWLTEEPKPKREPERITFRLHYFKPEKDITTLELAMILANTHAGTEPWTIGDGIYLPADKDLEEFFREKYDLPEMSRHFQPTELIETFEF